MLCTVWVASLFRMLKKSAKAPSRTFFPSLKSFSTRASKIDTAWMRPLDPRGWSSSTLLSGMFVIVAGTRYRRISQAPLRYEKAPETRNPAGSW